MNSIPQIFGKFLLVIIFIAEVSCNQTGMKATDTPTSGTTTIAVDETFEPVIQEETDVFESIYQSAEVLHISCPEVKAFNLLLHDSVGMVVATRLLNDQEKKFFADQKIFPKEIKIATDAIAFIVNKNNSDTLITTGLVKRILSGELKYWNEVNAKSELGAIKVVFDNTESSTAQYAATQICNGKLSGDLNALKSNREVIDYVAQNVNAIGIIGVNWISSHKQSILIGFQQGIKVMAVSKECTASTDNSFQPYQAYLSTGQYPYTRSVYIILTEPRNGLATGFTSFIASDRGQRIILKSGILPATQPVRLIHVNND